VLVIDAAPSWPGWREPRIENYFGFPTGISGQALAGRCYTQAQKFGAALLIPMETRHLDSRTSGARRADGAAARRRPRGARPHVVIATGRATGALRVQQPHGEEGRGVWYWASPIEAKMCAGEEVVLVARTPRARRRCTFSGHAFESVDAGARPGLAASMSKYLIDRIAATPNIELLTRTEITHLTGSRQAGVRIGRLARPRRRDPTAADPPCLPVPRRRSRAPDG